MKDDGERVRRHFLWNGEEQSSDRRGLDDAPTILSRQTRCEQDMTSDPITTVHHQM